MEQNDDVAGIDWASLKVSGEGTVVLNVIERDGSVGEIVLHDSTDPSVSGAALLFAAASSSDAAPAPDGTGVEFGSLVAADTLVFETAAGPVGAEIALEGLACGLVGVLVAAATRT